MLLLKGLRESPVMLIKRQRAKRAVLMSESLKGEKGLKNKMVLWSSCQALESINKRTHFFKNKTRLRETKWSRQSVSAPARGAATRAGLVGDLRLAGGAQFLDWGYSYRNAFLCEYLSVSTPIICAVCVCILYRIKHFSKNYVKQNKTKRMSTCTALQGSWVSSL